MLERYYIILRGYASTPYCSTNVDVIPSNEFHRFGWINRTAIVIKYSISSVQINLILRWWLNVLIVRVRLVFLLAHARNLTQNPIIFQRLLSRPFYQLHFFATFFKKYIATPLYFFIICDSHFINYVHS